VEESLQAVLELLNAAAAELEGMGKTEIAAEVRECISALSVGDEDEMAEESGEVETEEKPEVEG